MPASGVAYITSKEGILRAVIILFGCIAFALIADSGYAYSGVVEWVLAAYIISWCFSLLSYFFIATTLASKMNCGISYDVVDACLSVFSFFHCFMASVVLAMRIYQNEDKRIAADVFGFLVSILYAVEVYFLVGNAPENLKYLITKNGIIKTVICIMGCATFALLHSAGYRCSENGCDSARTWVFAAYIYCWVFSVILLLIRLSGFASMIPVIDKIDFVWSAFSFLNYLVASIVLACYLECPEFNSYRRPCNLRLCCDIFGFITTILYLVEAVFLKNGISGNVFPSKS